MRNIRATREFPLALRLLLFNQFGIDIGFYLLLPFLAAYLEQGLGMSAALVGFVLGARNLGQQGLFILGGSAADRLGPRTVIITGCALRTVGFGLFAFGNSLWLLLAASVLTGLAAALFYPAVRTYVALESGDRKAEAFALLNVYATIGSLLGLLLGSVLFLADFRLCAVVVAGVFGVLTVAQAMVLPTSGAAPAGPSASVLGDWREAFCNRRFLLFCLATTGMFTMENQLYLLLPEGALRASGWKGAAGVLLAAGAIANMLFQLRITRALGRNGGGTRWVSSGLVVMGVSFLPPLLVCGTEPPGSTREAVARMAVMVASSVMLFFGIMVAHPTAMEMIPGFGRESLTGTYFGLFYVFSGIAATAGNAVVGRAMDLGGQFGMYWLPWVCCLAFGLSSAGSVALLFRAGMLPVLPAPSGAPVAEGPVVAQPTAGGSGAAIVKRAAGPVVPMAPTGPTSGQSPQGPTASLDPTGSAGDGVRQQDAARLPGPARASDDAADQPPL
ncbi:MFS transporter [Streptomyces triculaminicus]|uniref:MFS transporter n=1 Tax=Streptomyces triculaminicus TaxID=2816232 RepID=A0A939FKF1_9ACTN|nr:MFS transporter [Streptomyces triculaminicus]